MSKVKAGDVVHLKHDPEVLFTVTEDTGSLFQRGFKGMFKIVRFDKTNNNKPIELEVHEDSLIVVEK